MNRSRGPWAILSLVLVVVLIFLFNSKAQTLCSSVIYAHILGFKDTVNSTTGYLTDNGNTYAFIYKPSGPPIPYWVLEPYFDGTNFNGYPAVGLEVQPTGSPLPSSDDGTDKANISVAQWPISQDRYYGFAMKLGNFGNPTVSILVAQWWQGVPYSPPLSLHIIPNSNYQCELQVRNNNTGGNPNATPIEIPLGYCTPGVWHTFVFYTRPHYVGAPGTGEITAWHNNMTTPVADWTGDVGYDPSIPVNTNGVSGNPQSPNLPNSSWTVYVGPYGDHQTIDRQAYYANIIVASTMAGANPNQ